MTKMNRASAKYFVNPTLENYSAMRRAYPEEPIDIGWPRDVEIISRMRDALAKFGVDPDLVEGAFRADERSIGELSLQLIDLLVARKKGKAKNAHQVSLGQAISDSYVNFMIRCMIEALKEQRRPIPQDLMVLLQAQLGSSGLPFNDKHLRELTRGIAKMFVGLGVPPTLRSLAEITGVNHTTVRTYFSQEEIREWREMAKRRRKLETQRD